MAKKKIKITPARNVREWFAFYGGEELGISLEHASIVWDAATEALTQKHGIDIDQLKSKIGVLANKADEFNAAGYSLDAFLGIFEKMHKLSK